MSAVVIGMDPRKRSATIEVMTSAEAVLGGGRYGTDASGYRAVRRWPERTWAIEGCQGIGWHIARRLIAGGEHVADIPPKLSARTRVFATGQGRKTDATDAHSVALAATRMTGLRPLSVSSFHRGVRRNGTRMSGTCWARIHDRGVDRLSSCSAWGCQTVIRYSCVSPPRACSAFLDAGERPSRTSQPQNRMKIR
jgi:hypothetical protein